MTGTQKRAWERAWRLPSIGIHFGWYVGLNLRLRLYANWLPEKGLAVPAPEDSVLISTSYQDMRWALKMLALGNWSRSVMSQGGG